MVISHLHQDIEFKLICDDGKSRKFDIIAKVVKVVNL